MAARRNGAKFLLEAGVGERRTLVDVTEMVRQWLAGNARAVLSGSTTDPPNMAAWLGMRTWETLMNANLVPRLEDIWLKRWTDSGARSDPGRWLGNYIRDMRNRLRSFRDTSWQVARNVLADGVARGESIPQLRNRIGRALNIDAPSRASIDRLMVLDAIIDDPNSTPEQRERARDERAPIARDRAQSDNLWHWRAERIARTEALSAYNSGAYSAAFQSATEGAELGLEWWATRDERTRATHRAAHGQIVRVGEAFTVGGAKLLYPGDPTGPPQEVINCRCVALAVDLLSDAGGRVDASGVIPGQLGHPRGQQRQRGLTEHVDDHASPLGLGSGAAFLGAGRQRGRVNICGRQYLGDPCFHQLSDGFGVLVADDALGSVGGGRAAQQRQVE